MYLELSANGKNPHRRPIAKEKQVGLINLNIAIHLLM